MAERLRGINQRKSSWAASNEKYVSFVSILQTSEPGMNFNRENRLQRRSKNILRRITMGIGPIWGINSVSPFILSCFKISKIVFYKSLSFGLITYNIMFLTGNIWRRSGQQLHRWHSNWRLLFESRVMFLWWVLNNCTSVTCFKHRQTTLSSCGSCC